MDYSFIYLIHILFGGPLLIYGGYIGKTLTDKYTPTRLKIIKVDNWIFWLSVNSDANPAKNEPIANGKIKKVGTKSSANRSTAAAMNHICVIKII